jgi:hypothetical protein
MSKKTIYFVENIAGGNSQFYSLKKACEAATSWGASGTIEEKNGVRHVAADFGTDNGYHISDYNEDAEEFSQHIGE